MNSNGDNGNLTVAVQMEDKEDRIQPGDNNIASYVVFQLL
jgi:hypothetical protein